MSGILFIHFNKTIDYAIAFKKLDEHEPKCVETQNETAEREMVEQISVHFSSWLENGFLIKCQLHVSVSLS